MPKMQSYLYGANHNWFNTVWFQDEGWPSFGPNRLTDAQQRDVERAMGTAFFREYLEGFQTEDFDIGLEDTNGNSTYVKVRQFDVIPFSYDRPGGEASMLQTIRLGLPCFYCMEHNGLNIHSIAKIHFRFNRKPTGLVGLDDVQFSH